MIICNYGCGQEAKYQFKNGKWCCSKNFRSCPAKRRKNSIQIKKLRGDLDSIYNSDSYKENISKAMKGKGKLTIEKIKEQHLFFSKIEEMRYNPDKPGEKEIQVHCKYNGCKNSKEKGGWFTPTSKQIIDRKNMIINESEDKSNFYCSQYCKDTCPCYRLRSDPLQLTKFHQYHRKVQKFTNLSLKYNSDKILNIELRGRKYGYDLDHKFSIIDGFNNDIDPRVIGHWKNLEVIKTFDNRKKWMTSSIHIDKIQIEL